VCWCKYNDDGGGGGGKKFKKKGPFKYLAMANHQFLSLSLLLMGSSSNRAAPFSMCIHTTAGVLLELLECRA
jgi:hypothetical protein